MPLAWHDGTLVEKNTITVSVADYGFNRGVGIYELTRIYGGVPLHMDDHINRFEAGARKFGIQTPFEREVIIAACRELLSRNRFEHSTLRFYLTAGECKNPGDIGFGSFDNFTPHLMILEDEAKPAHSEAPRGLELYRRGISLKTVPFSRQMPEVKSVDYASGFVVARQLANEGWNDILYIHSDGYVTEMLTANFFCVIDDVLCTPAREMLFGVTRKILLELAPKANQRVAERNIGSDDLTRVTEAFVTGTFAEMVPVRKINDHNLATTMDGPVFSKLRKAFSAYIADYSPR